MSADAESRGLPATIGWFFINFFVLFSLSFLGNAVFAVPLLAVAHLHFTSAVPALWMAVLGISLYPAARHNSDMSWGDADPGGLPSFSKAESWVLLGLGILRYAPVYLAVVGGVVVTSGTAIAPWVPMVALFGSIFEHQVAETRWYLSPFVWLVYLVLKIIQHWGILTQFSIESVVSWNRAVTRPR